MNIIKTIIYLFQGRGSIFGEDLNKNLGVIGIEMILNILVFTDDFGQRGSIEEEQEWAKYWYLGNTKD